jgi:DNA-binding XRE family transcriptional regulator
MRLDVGSVAFFPVKAFVEIVFFIFFLHQKGSINDLFLSCFADFQDSDFRRNQWRNRSIEAFLVFFRYSTTMKDVLLTPSLVRAARAMIDWQQSDLAAEAGLSLTAVKNFEWGKRTHEKTTRAISTAFENHGVEFPLSGGVRKADDTAVMVRITGPDFVQRMNEDMYAALRRPNSEVLTVSTNEALWPEEPSVIYHAWRARLHINSRTLIPEGQRFVKMAQQNYRVLPPEMIGKIAYILYADRLTFVLWKKSQALIIRNPQIVETFRGQFAFLWRLGKPL